MSELVEVLQEAKAALHACPACPVKGACVYATPEYEPGYGLHEYRLLHAYVAQRLRAHPPAGLRGFERLRAEAMRFVQTIRAQAPYGGPFELPDSLAWHGQATLARYG